VTTFDAVVLAGGSARRLGGRDKPALDVGGRSMLDAVVTACAAADRTVVVGPASGNPSIIVGGVPQGGVVSYCAQAQETLVIANRLVDDPTQWDAIPKVCEHFITRMPGDKSLVSYCEVVMQSVGFKKKEGAAAVAKELADDDAFVLKNTAPFDWRRALIENRPAMRELIQLYARKGR